MAIHLLAPKQMQSAGLGVHDDGGGLFLRVATTGTSWVFRFTSPSGRRRSMGLGIAMCRSLALAGDSLTNARKAAERARRLLADGIDPLAQRKQERAGAQAQEAEAKADRQRERRTLARCAREYHARVIEPKKTTKHAAQWISSLENHMPAPVWHKPIADVTPPELLAALRAVKPHASARNIRGPHLPETVQRMRQRLDVVFADAIFHGHCTSNPAAAIKHKMRDELPENEAGDDEGFRALPYREAPAFFRALAQQPGTAARCMEALMLTAARTNEAIGMDARHLDLADARWHVPKGKMKGRKAHDVFLPARVVALLETQLSYRLHPTIVFPSPEAKNNDRSLSNGALLALLKRMGYHGKTTVHGLRATFSTWAYETHAAPPDVIEATLAHKEPDRVKRSYNRAKFNADRRALLQAWADYLDNQGADVVPLGKAA